jgi:hypothetical protein
VSVVSLGDVCCACVEDVIELFAFFVGLEKQFADHKEAAQYVMDIYVPQEKGQSQRSWLTSWMTLKVE